MPCVASPGVSANGTTSGAAAGTAAGTGGCAATFASAAKLLEANLKRSFLVEHIASRHYVAFAIYRFQAHFFSTAKFRYFCLMGCSEE